MIYENAMAIGRFHGLHIGHVKLIRSVISLSKRSIIFVGSAQERDTERNPFSIHMRMDMLKAVFHEEIIGGRVRFEPLCDLTDETDVSHSWGRYLICETVKHTGNLPDLTVFGKEPSHQLWYSPEDDSKMATLSIPRGSTGISATELRWYIANDDYHNYVKHTPERVHNYFDTLRKSLLDIPFYKELLKNRGIASVTSR